MGRLATKPVRERARRAAERGEKAGMTTPVADWGAELGGGGGGELEASERVTASATGRDVSSSRSRM